MRGPVCSFSACPWRVNKPLNILAYIEPKAVYAPRLFRRVGNGPIPDAMREVNARHASPILPHSRFVAVIAALGLGAAAKADTPRIPFQIATGSTTGSFFPVGEADCRA